MTCHDCGQEVDDGVYDATHEWWTCARCYAEMKDFEAWETEAQKAGAIR